MLFLNTIYKNISGNVDLCSHLKNNILYVKESKKWWKHIEGTDGEGMLRDRALDVAHN